jgi:hypothetical protein
MLRSANHRKQESPVRKQSRRLDPRSAVTNARTIASRQPRRTGESLPAFTSITKLVASTAGKAYDAHAGAPNRKFRKESGKMTDPDIEGLNLSDVARNAAYALKTQCPQVIFTSGRRDKHGQASAMAYNVVRNRNFIGETYHSDAGAACQQWVDNNSDQQTQSEIAAGLEGVLNGLPDSQLAHLSKHLSGDAFDVQPVDLAQGGETIKQAIRGLTGLSKFLDSEGGLVRWHAQF